MPSTTQQDSTLAQLQQNVYDKQGFDRVVTVTAIVMATAAVIAITQLQ